MRRIEYNGFMSVSSQLMAMGISNNEFMLEVKNKAVEDINPYDDGITDEEQDIVIEEIKNNFWYFLREIVNIPSPSGAWNAFELNLMNATTLFALRAGCNVALIAPRQTGKLTLFLINYIYDVICSDSPVAPLSEIQDAKCKSLVECLPVYVRELYEVASDLSGEPHGIICTDFINNNSDIREAYRSLLPSLITTTGCLLHTPERKLGYNYMMDNYDQVTFSWLDEHHSSDSRPIRLTCTASECGQDAQYYEAGLIAMNKESGLFLREYHNIFM